MVSNKIQPKTTVPLNNHQGFIDRLTNLFAN